MKDLAREDPRNVESRIRLVVAHQRAGQHAAAACVLEDIAALEPDNPAWRVALAEAYLAAHAVCAARHELRSARQSWPDDPLLAAADPLQAQLEAACHSLLAAHGWADQPLVAELGLHELQQVYAIAGDFARAVSAGEQLVTRLPRFVRGWNNLAEAYFHEHRRSDAERALRHVLQLDPANIFALATLMKVSFLGGRMDDARQAADQLPSCTPEGASCWVKMAEAAAWLGDDEGVLAALRGFETDDAAADPIGIAMTHHLAAVALWRLDRAPEARRHWRRSLQALPGFALAQENLDTWQRDGQEFTPWFFDLRYWFPEPLIETWRELAARNSGKDPDGSQTETAQAIVEAYPELVALVPALCDRGDPASRKLALMLARESRCYDMLQGLKSFALGRRGSQAQRIEVANLLIEECVLSPGTFHMFVEGKWQDVLMFGWEVTEEPTIPPLRSEEVQLMCEEAHAALGAKDWKKAERLLRAARAREPDAPDLANNLAMALGAQGRKAESRAILDEIFERWPDYFFGVVAKVQLAIQSGDYDRAFDLLTRLAQRRQLHVSELRAMSQGFIRLHLIKQQPEAAQNWLQLWQQFECDHPDQDSWEGLVNASLLLLRLGARGVSNPFRKKPRLPRK